MFIANSALLRARPTKADFSDEAPVYILENQKHLHNTCLCHYYRKCAGVQVYYSEIDMAMCEKNQGRCVCVVSSHIDFAKIVLH